jgi:hypothetical protein
MTAKSRHRERYEPGFMLMDLHRGGIPAIMRKYELQALYRGALWEVDDDTVGDYHPLIPYANVCTEFWRPSPPPS